MIELQKNDLERLDSILDIISEHGLFGIDFKAIEKKQPDFFLNIIPEDLIDSVYFDHKVKEYERLASFFKKYDCGNVKEATAFEGGELTISKNHNSLQFKKQGGFKELYSELKEKKKRENIEFKKSKIDLKLAKKVLKEFPKTKWFARFGFIIAIVLLLKELYMLIWK
jgi:hypothetical protein